MYPRIKFNSKLFGSRLRQNIEIYLVKAMENLKFKNLFHVCTLNWDFPMTA